MVAREIFGKRRFEEIVGELWLCRDRVGRSARRLGDTELALRRWECDFRRDTEQGRYREGKNGRRRRVARFSELEQPGGQGGGGPVEDHVRRAF